MRVIVLDGHANPAVASVRALGKQGHDVCVGAAQPWSKATWSRFCRESFVYPSAKSNLNGFVQTIAEKTSLEPGTFVLPLTEPAVLAVSAHRELIQSAGGRLILPPHEALMRACDKLRTTAMAASAGIRVPKTWILNSNETENKLADTIDYPVVLKPRASEEIHNDNRVTPTCRPQYARNRDEFLTAFSEVRTHCSSMLVQEFIHGEGVLISVLLSRGQLKAEFSYKRIRSVHPTGFGAALRVSVPPNPTIRDAALTLIRALDPEWHGIANVEFRACPDGTFVFLEVNPRNVHSLPLAINAGVNFPCLLANLAARGDVAVSAGYSEGVACRWLYGDFLRLVYIWMGAARNYPDPLPSRMEALMQFMKPTRGASHDNFTFDDPVPEFAEWLNGALNFSITKLRRKTQLASAVDT